MPTRSFLPVAPPFRFLAEYLVQDEGFVSDANAVLGVSDESLSKLVKALTDFDGFLDRAALSGIVAGTLPPDQNPDGVSRVIWRLDRYVRESDEALDESVRLLKAAIEKHTEALQESARSKLGERLEALLGRPGGFARQHKAERLVEATGRELAGLQVICDVRPVFNEGRTEIQGAIPVSTLRLDLIEPDGLASSADVRLSEAQLKDLCEKAESARRKVTLIKQMLGEKGIPLPKTPATMNEGDGL